MQHTYRLMTLNINGIETPLDSACWTIFYTDMMPTLLYYMKSLMGRDWWSRVINPSLMSAHWGVETPFYINCIYSYINQIAYRQGGGLLHIWEISV
jgi:hypothetical protein